MNGRRCRAFPTVPLAVPDWNGDTYRNIFSCLIGAQVVAGPHLGALKTQIIKTLGVTDAILCGSGTLALELALRACAVHAGDEVVLPTFCCTAVVPPILAVGATPVLADVGAELNLTVENVGAALTRKTKAVIVPHLFGNPAEIDKIVEFVRGKNISVIDDAAQALGATIDGRPVGSFGDAGIVSFGAEKVCFGIRGGALVWRGGETARAAAGLGAPRPIPALKNFLSTWFFRRGRRWTRPLGVLFAPKSPNELPLPYRREAMSNLAAAVASSLMQTIGENISARRARVAAYGAMLSDCAQIELIPHRAGSACLTQVVRVLPRRRADDGATDVVAALGAAGYEVRGSYVPIHMLAAFERCVWDRLSNADRLWAELVELPCEPSVSLIDIERITALVKNVTRRRPACA